MHDTAIPETQSGYRVAWLDTLGVPRVWGDGPTESHADRQAQEARTEYVSGRPDVILCKRVVAEYIAETETGRVLLMAEVSA